MNNNINLVSGKNLNLEKQAKRLKYIRITALLSLIIVASISIIFFLITFFLPISSVRQQQTQALQGVSKLHKQLVTYSLVSERLGNIKKVIAKRNSYPDTVKEFFDKLPQGSVINELDVDQGKLTVMLSNPSLISLNQFIDEFILVADKRKNISNAYIKTLQYNLSTSDYSLTFVSEILD